MRPTIYIVRERFIEGEPYRAAIFGVFNSKKFAVALRKKILAEVPAIFHNVEIVSMNLGYRHEFGVHMTETKKEIHEND